MSHTFIPHDLSPGLRFRGRDFMDVEMIYTIRDSMLPGGSLPGTAHSFVP